PRPHLHSGTPRNAPICPPRKPPIWPAPKPPPPRPPPPPPPCPPPPPPPPPPRACAPVATRLPASSTVAKTVINRLLMIFLHWNGRTFRRRTFVSCRRV